MILLRKTFPFLLQTESDDPNVIATYLSRDALLKLEMLFQYIVGKKAYSFRYLCFPVITSLYQLSSCFIQYEGSVFETGFPPFFTVFKIFLFADILELVWFFLRKSSQTGLVFSRKTREVEILALNKLLSCTLFFWVC